MTAYNYQDSSIAGFLAQVEELAIAYLQNLRDRPTMSGHDFSHHELPAAGRGESGALELFRNELEPLMVASSGPRYWGFVTGGSTPAAIAGDWLAAVYDQNPQGTAGAGDRSALMELQTIQMMLQLLGLPDAFAGGFVTGATIIGNFSTVTLLASSPNPFSSDRLISFSQK